MQLALVGMLVLGTAAAQSPAALDAQFNDATKIFCALPARRARSIRVAALKALVRAEPRNQHTLPTSAVPQPEARDA